MLVEHRQQTAEDEPHTLHLQAGAALPGHVLVFSVLTAEVTTNLSHAKGYKRKGTWLTHRTESLSQIQETFRIFPEH